MPIHTISQYLTVFLDFTVQSRRFYQCYLQPFSVLLFEMTTLTRQAARGLIIDRVSQVIKSCLASFAEKIHERAGILFRIFMSVP